MNRKLRFDPVLFATATLMPLFGLVMIYSASDLIGQQDFNDPYHFLVRQTISFLVGLAALLAAMHIDYRKLARPAVIYGLFSGSCLLLIATHLYHTGSSAQRWLRAGNFSFQPSELAKLALVLFLAYHLARRREKVEDPLTNLLPCLLVMATLAFLIYLQPDLGTALSICFIGSVILFIAGLPLRHLALVGAGGVTALGLGILMKPYQWARIEAFLHPESDPLGNGFQAQQSLLAIGSGGLTGLNLGAGRQKMFYLPEPHTDFIFSVIGEELGLLGTGLVLVGFSLLLWRGVVSSLRAPCLFGKYLAAGITFCIVLQALENMAIALRMIPTTGITLPFLSFGGSSLVVTMLAMGILLNISQHAR